MKTINITNGDAFNNYIKTRKAGVFIPFKEAMIEGNPKFPLFDDAFCKERVCTHMPSSSILDYRKHMSDFLNINFNEIDEIVLWFGKEAFCQLNLLTVLAYLKQLNYKGNVYLNTIVDETYKTIKEREKINLFDCDYIDIYKSIFIAYKPKATNNLYLKKAARVYLLLKDDNGPLAFLIKENSHLPKQELFELVWKETRNFGLGDKQVSKLIQKYTNNN